MAGLVYTNYGGLVLAEQAMDESSVRRALKRLDPELRLARDDSEGAPLYRVFKFMGESSPAAWICDWRGEDGKPLPLTHRLLDKVQGLALGSRAPQPDPEAHNQRLREQAAIEWQEALSEQIKDGERRLKRAPCFPPGQYLRQSRDKQRARGHNL